MNHHLSDLSMKTKIAAGAIEVGGIYCHYRSPEKHYKVLAIGIQEATEEPCVVYENLYGDHVIWVRNVNVWLEPVMHEGKLVPRFQKIG